MTFALMLGFFLLVTLVGAGVDVYTCGGVDPGVPYSTLISLALASVNGLLAYYFGSSIVIRSLGATELSFDDLSHKKPPEGTRPFEDNRAGD